MILDPLASDEKGLRSMTAPLGAVCRKHGTVLLGTSSALEAEKENASPWWTSLAVSVGGLHPWAGDKAKKIFCVLMHDGFQVS